MSNHKTDITSKELDEILAIVFDLYGYDFQDYARASMFRRIQRFMDEKKYSDAFELKYQLTNDPKVFDAMLQKITVNVTEMFRDPSFFAAIKNEVVPMLASYPVIKIWHPGCASGEEVFSMAILLHEAGLLQRSRIYATDVNPMNIEKGKEGILPLSLMKEYEINYLKAGGVGTFSDYYTAAYDHAIINKALRKNIFFSHHNLVTDRVFNEFQMICCRNVMIYFNKKLQNRVVELLHESLSPLGYLAIGLKESLLFTEVQKKFISVDKFHKIYRRIN